MFRYKQWAQGSQDPQNVAVLYVIVSGGFCSKRHVTKYLLYKVTVISLWVVFVTSTISLFWCSSLQFQSSQVFSVIVNLVNV